MKKVNMKRKPVWKLVHPITESCVRIYGRSISIRIEDKYSLEYKSGKITTALPETLGVFCFKRKIDAEDFRDTFTELNIIKVIPIGKGTTPKRMGSPIINGIGDFYKGDKRNARIPPDGTICYPKVYVI